MKDIERMVVSAYEDGEVDSPWKERVSRKISEDPEWKAEADVHRMVKDSLGSSPEPDFSEVQARVWSALQAKKPREVPVLHGTFVWGTVAAAALLVLATGTGYWLGRTGATPATSGSDVAELKVQVPKQLELKLSGEGQLIMASTLQGSLR